MPRGAELVEKQPKSRTWVWKLLVSIVWFFLLAEISSRILFSLEHSPRWATSWDDSSFRLVWVKLHRVKQDPAGQFAVYNPMRGWALKPGIKNMSVFDGKILNTNSRGLRGTSEYDYQRQPGKQRILILGDSFTFGTEVSDNDTFSHQLETLLPNTEVLNFGIHAYGTDQMLLYLKEEGVKYRPDVVILGYVYNDTIRNLRTFYAYSKPKFEFRSDGLQLTNVPVPPPERFLAEEFYRPKSLDLAVILFEKIRWSLPINDERAKIITRPILDEFVATTRGIGAVPVFVYLPVYDEVDSSQSALTPHEQYMYDYCQARGVLSLFIRRRFQEEVSRGAKLKSQGHWNRQEHTAAAEAIRDFLLLNHLIQAPSATTPTPPQDLPRRK